MATLADLEQNIGETTKLYEDYVALVKNKIKSLEEQLKVFTEDKDKIASSEQQLAAKVKELEGNVEAVSQEKASALEKAAALESELESLKSSSGTKDEELTKTQSELDKANETASAKNAELLKITGDLGEVKEQLTGLTAEKTAIDEKINTVNVQLDALKKRIQDESASLSGPVDSTREEPEVTGQGTEVNLNQADQRKLEHEGLVEITESKIVEYKNNVDRTLADEQKKSFDNLKAKLLKRIEVLQKKGNMLSNKESIEYQKLQALNIPEQNPETVPEPKQGGKTRKNGKTRAKKSKTYKRVKNGGKKSKTYKRVKNGTKKSNRKTRK